MTADSSDSYAAEWLALEKRQGSRLTLGGTAKTLLEQFNKLVAQIVSQSPPPDPAVSTSDQTANGIAIRIYKPLDNSSETLPIGVYYHGGGYLMGNLDSEDAWCRYISKNTPCILVSVDYRLSTEKPFPVMLEDSLAAYEWAWHNASSLGGDQSSLFTCGASAGGGLALTVADQIIKAKTDVKVGAVIAMVPITAHPESIPEKYKSQYTAYEENKNGVPVIDADSMRFYFEAAGANFHDEKLLVTLSKGLASFPPTYVCTCGKDPLRDDGKVLVSMLNDIGVTTKEDSYPGFPHYFWMFPGLEAGETFLANVVKGVQWALSA